MSEDLLHRVNWASNVGVDTRAFLALLSSTSCLLLVRVATRQPGLSTSGPPLRGLRRPLVHTWASSSAPRGAVSAEG